MTFNNRNIPDRPDAPAEVPRTAPPAPPPPPPPGASEHTVPMLPREVPDSEAVLAFLLSKSGVDRSGIAAGGASCGVSAAVALARKRSEIRALVLVAGFARPDGLDFLAATPRLAVYGVAAREDATGPFDINAAVTASKHPRSTQTLYDGWEHGAAPFARDPGFTPAVARWLMDVLQP